MKLCVCFGTLSLQTVLILSICVILPVSLTQPFAMEFRTASWTASHLMRVNSFVQVVQYNMLSPFPQHLSKSQKSGLVYSSAGGVL